MKECCHSFIALTCFIHTRRALCCPDYQVQHIITFTPPKTWEQCLPASYTLNFLSFIQFRLDVGCKYKKKYWNMRTFFHKILHIPIFSCKSCASSTATDGSLQTLTWRSDKPHQVVPAPRLLPLPWWVPRYIHG